jgi:hypothetical protein
VRGEHHARALRVAVVDGLAARPQHGLLRRDELVGMPVHEDHRVIVILGQPREQERDDLHGLAAGRGQPRQVAVLVEPLDRLELEVALRIAVVGHAHAVHERHDAARLEHAHHHRGARPGQARHDHDRPAVTQPAQ